MFSQMYHFLLLKFLIYLDSVACISDYPGTCYTAIHGGFHACQASLELFM